MRIRTVVLIGTSSVAALAAANASAALVTSVPVGNASFETLGTRTDGNWHGLPSGGAWVAPSYGGYQIDHVGDSNITTDPDASTSASDADHPGTQHVLNLPASLTQDLNTTVAAGQQIELDFLGGRSPDFTAGNITAEILIDNVVVGSQVYDLSTGANAGTLYAQSPLLSTATAPGDLSISFLNSSGTTDFLDGVSVSVSTPEPASLALMGLGAAGLLVRRRRS